MSVMHLKQELIQLSPADRREIEVFLIELRVGAEAENAPAETGRKMSHDEAMDYVFKGFAPALAKLAQ